MVGVSKLSLKAFRCSVEHSRPWKPPQFPPRIAKWSGVRRQKVEELTYPELVGRRSRAGLVVLAGEVGGRWSAETMSFLGLLAKARARSGTRSRVGKRGASVRARMLACAAAFASSLLEQRVPVGSDGNTIASHEVVAHHRHSCLG